MNMLFCPKCKSNHIGIFVEERKPKLKSMDEWVKEPRITSTPAIMVYKTEIAKCGDCGYEVKRTR